MGKTIAAPNPTATAIAQRTKTSKSQWDIQLVQPWLSIIRAHRRKQFALRKKLQHRELLAAQGFDKLLFTREDGTPIRHQIENAEWKALLKRARATEILGATLGTSSCRC